jgi:glycerol-3-phosphate acyltransferase PlsY
MKCLDCPLEYIGQTSRAFHTRYKEHIQAIRNSNSNSGYSNHILNTGHKYGATTDIMDIVKTHRKGKN